MTFEEGPGILIIPITPSPPGEPLAMITIDEKYLTALFAEKFGLTVNPRE